MLTAHHLTKTYNLTPILRDVSFNISGHDRIGLIGPNGCGKTTLLRLLTGQEKPDSGNITPTRPGLRVGYLAQGLEPAKEETLRTTLGLDTISTDQLEAEISSLAVALAANPGSTALQARYDSTLAQLSISDLQPETILGPLGLGHFPLETLTHTLSGGQKTRLLLAKILLHEPHLLLLDEPTNHLDIAMLEWLEDWLAGFPGAALIVSHDRAFLDNTVNTILELEPGREGIRAYAGNYTDYLEQKIAEREHQQQSWQDQQDEIAQLKSAAAHLRGMTIMKKGGKADTNDKFAKGFFGNRATKNVAGRAKTIEARIEKLLTEDKIERPRPSWQMKLDFGAPAHQSKDVFIAENLSIGYTPGNPLAAGLNISLRAGQRVALTGPNGAGKTTLLRTIAGKLEPLKGSVRTGANVRVGYMSQEQESLELALTPLQSIQKVAPFNETEARHFLHFFLFSGDDPLRPNATLSYGERARLQLGMLVAQGCTFLMLDEPLNHLDIPSRARFEQALGNFKGAVLAVVHDRYFIQQFAEETWHVENGQVTRD